MYFCTEKRTCRPLLAVVWTEGGSVKFRSAQGCVASLVQGIILLSSDLSVSSSLPSLFLLQEPLSGGKDYDLDFYNGGSADGKAVKPRPISDLRFFAASPGHRPEIVGALCLPELCFFLHLACHSVGQGATQGVHGMPRQLLQLGGPAPQMRVPLLFHTYAVHRRRVAQLREEPSGRCKTAYGRRLAP